MKFPKFTTKQILLASFAFGMVGAISFCAMKYMHTSDATMNGFKAGNIMSDYVMGNYNTMNESQIQNFLNSKNSCNKGVSGGGYIGAGNDYGVTFNYGATYGDKYYHYHANNNKYICLGNERFNGKTAAHIIYRAAQDYRINPQVLLVLLQKEQSLITDQWPNTNYQYRSATGYGCPDTAPCNSEYYGLENQIRNAADLFRKVLDNDYNPYHSGRTAYIQYNPNAGCGGSNVYIENRATAALYRYTPYQPGGSGSCAAYGNRNFYDYFTDWFGDTHTSLGVDASIVEGDYIIASSNRWGKALDVNGANTANGTNIQLWDRNSGPAQRWHISYNSSTGYYSIINPNSNKSLDLSNADTTNGTNVQLWDRNNTCAQQWKLIEASGNDIIIASACSTSSALEIYNYGTNNGTNVNIWTSHGGSNQRWQLIPADSLASGTYTISSNMNINKTVDVYGGNSANGTNIQLWDKHGGASQKWTVKYDAFTGFYTFINPSSGKALDINGAKTANGTNIQLWDYNNSCAQRWRGVKKADSTFVFFSACSHSKAIDLYSSRTTNGTNIHIWTAHGGVNQQWKFTPVEIIPEGNFIITPQKDSNKALDVYGPFNTNGTNIHLWNRHEGVGQRWHITYNSSNGYYTVINPFTNKALDVNNASTINGTNIQLWERNNSCAQKWDIVRYGDSYVFCSACANGMVMELYNYGLGPGTNVHLWNRHNQYNQLWQLNRT